MTLKPGQLAAAVVATLMFAVVGLWWLSELSRAAPWNADEVRILETLWLGSLPDVPADPTNRVADDLGAAKLGQRLFFDARLSANGEVACATCHQPNRYFTDGLPRGEALGTSRRNTLSLVGAAYSPWLYWDGRKDSLWSQALSPLEDAQEHGGNRLQFARLISTDPAYRSAYEALFGPLPNLADWHQFPLGAAPVGEASLTEAWLAMPEEVRQPVTQVFVNLGKSIAAYERLLVPGSSRFDDYVRAVLDIDTQAQRQLFSKFEIAGLRLFIGKGNCIQCHNGPLLTNNEFHNTGVLSAVGQVPDKGRIDGVQTARADPLNCLGVFSDGVRDDCAELIFAKVGSEVMGALRTPSLRNVEQTAPYMHGGQLITLEAVLQHYNQAPLAMIGHNEAKPLNFSRRELKQLRAFLGTLGAPAAIDEKWLSAPD